MNRHDKVNSCRKYFKNVLFVYTSGHLKKMSKNKRKSYLFCYYTEDALIHSTTARYVSVGVRGLAYSYYFSLLRPMQTDLNVTYTPCAPCVYREQALNRRNCKSMQYFNWSTEIKELRIKRKVQIFVNNSMLGAMLKGEPWIGIE